MRIIANRGINLTDRLSKRGLRKEPGHRSAAQKRRRQPRLTHVNRKGNARKQHERKHAENDKKRAALPHLRSSSDKRLMFGIEKPVRNVLTL